ALELERRGLVLLELRLAAVGLDGPVDHLPGVRLRVGPAGAGTVQEQERRTGHTQSRAHQAPPHRKERSELLGRAGGVVRPEAAVIAASRPAPRRRPW